VLEDLNRSRRQKGACTNAATASWHEAALRGSNAESNSRPLSRRYQTYGHSWKREKIPNDILICHCADRWTSSSLTASPVTGNRWKAGGESMGRARQGGSTLRAIHRLHQRAGPVAWENHRVVARDSGERAQALENCISPGSGDRSPTWVRRRRRRSISRASPICSGVDFRAAR